MHQNLSIKENLFKSVLLNLIFQYTDTLKIMIDLHLLTIKKESFGKIIYLRI